MVTLTAPSHLTARERARRAARGGASRSVPAPLLAPALIAIAFLVLPLAGLLVRTPWRSLGAALSGSDATQALVLSLWTASATTVISLVIGVPLAWVLARSSFPGQRLLRALVTLPLVLPPVVGGVALLLAFGRDGFVGRYLDSWFGPDDPVHPDSGGHGRDLRRHAVPDHHRRGGAAVGRPGLRGGGGHAGRGADDRLPARHGAHDRPLPGGGRGAVLGAGPGRVRGDDHLRRQLPRPDRDDAHRRVLRAGE